MPRLSFDLPAPYEAAIEDYLTLATMHQEKSKKATRIGKIIDNAVSSFLFRAAVYYTRLLGRVQIDFHSGFSTEVKITDTQLAVVSIFGNRSTVLRRAYAPKRRHSADNESLPNIRLLERNHAGEFEHRYGLFSVGSPGIGKRLTDSHAIWPSWFMDGRKVAETIIHAGQNVLIHLDNAHDDQSNFSRKESLYGTPSTSRVSYS